MAVFQALIAIILVSILCVLVILNKKLNAQVKVRQKTEENMNQRSDHVQQQKPDDKLQQEDESIIQTTIKKPKPEGFREKLNSKVDEIEKNFDILGSNQVYMTKLEKQVEEQVDVNREIQEIECQVKKYMKSTFRFFSDILFNNYHFIYRMINFRKKDTEFPKYRLEMKGHFNLLVINMLILLLMLVTINVYIYSLEKTQFMFILLPIYLVSIVVNIIYNRFIVQNVVLPLIYNFDGFKQEDEDEQGLDANHESINQESINNEMDLENVKVNDQVADGSRDAEQSLELSPTRTKKDLKPLFRASVQRVVNDNIVNNMIQKKDREQDNKSISSRLSYNDEVDNIKNSYYFTKGQRYRTMQTKYQRENRFIKKFIYYVKEEIEDDKEKIQYLHSQQQTQSFNDLQIFFLFIMVMIVIFYIYLIFMKVSDSESLLLIGYLLGFTLADHVVIRTLVLLIYSTVYYKRYQKSYNFEIRKYKDVFIRKNLAYQLVMDKTLQDEIQYIQQKEQKKKQQVEEIKQMLKEYKKNQIQDIQEEDVMNNNNENGKRQNSFSDDSDDYDSDEDRWKLGRFRRRKGIFYGEYSSSILNEPFFNQEKTKQINDLLDDSVVASPVKILDCNKTMDMSGGTLMMSSYNSSIQRRTALFQTGGRRQSEFNVFQNIKGGVGSRFSRASGMGGGVMDMRNAMFNFNQDDYDDDDDDDDDDDISNRTDNSNDMNMLQKIKCAANKLENIDDFERTELQREFMGIMQLNNRKLDQKDIQIDVEKEKEKAKTNIFGIRQVTELEEENL